MIKSFEKINDKLINEVCSDFEVNYDFNLLRNKYSYLDYNVLYSILYSKGKYNIIDYLCQLNINDKKILVISDTHYGSKYENMKYTDKMFEFAKTNSINTILHGGDIIESNVNQRKSASNIKQVNYFINNYPSDDKISTLALLGNHDYLAIKEDEMIRNILSSRKDINILGFKKVYLNWCKNIISLQHNIKSYKLSLPNDVEEISFKGHSHFYHIKENTNEKYERIYIPSMCDDPIPYISSNPNINENVVIKPGFLLAQIEDNNIIVNNYSFMLGEVVKENEFVKTLKKF